MDFLNGLFLVGTAAALVPIIIHLVQRRRVQQVVFGSLRLLRRTSHRVVHRRRFEEFLLVLLRALALGVLAVAFARPFLPRSHEERVGGKTFAGEEAALVLVDNSYSMQAEGRLDRAKEEALKFLRQADPSTKLGVATYSSQLDELCPIGAKLAEAEEAVRRIQPSWRGTKLALALKQADRLLTRADRSEQFRRIILVGDFQASSWESASHADWTLSPGVELAVRDVARKAVPNVFIERVVVPRLVVAGGLVEVISANVRNLTDQPLNDARVTFHVNGKEEGTLSVNVRPGEDAPVRFRYKFTEPGDAVGTVTVHAEDELPADNVARFCVHVTPRVHVLLVNADRAEKMVLNDGLFLKTALTPAVEGVVSPFEVREIAPGEMRPEDFDGMDVVLFLNVSGGLSAEALARAGRFVAAGGGLGFICGSKVVPEEFNSTFGGLAPCKLLRLAMQEGDPPVVINQTDPRHEVFAEFAQPHSGDFSLAEFAQYFLVTDSLRATVPARFSSKDAHPALLERDFALDGARPEAGGRKAVDSGQWTVDSGKRKAEESIRNPQSAIRNAGGKSLLFVSSLDMEWNTLCLKSVFVPFVHQLTKRLCARRTGSARNSVVGEDVACRLPADAGEPKLRRLDGEKGAAPAALKAQGGVASFSPGAPGIYEVAYEGGSARFAVNLDPSEPDLRPLDTKLLVSTVQKGPALEERPAPGAVSVVAKSTARERVESHQRVWWYLMLAMLAALTGEMLLATRIGRM